MLNLDRDLTTRIVISSLLLIGFTFASAIDFHVGIIGPLAVIGVVVTMFWPRHVDDGSQVD